MLQKLHSQHSTLDISKLSYVVQSKNLLNLPFNISFTLLHSSLLTMLCFNIFEDFDLCAYHICKWYHRFYYVYMESSSISSFFFPTITICLYIAAKTANSYQIYIMAIVKLTYTRYAYSLAMRFIDKSIQSRVKERP